MYKKGILTIRPMDETDLEFIRSIRNDESTWMNLTNVEMISDAQQKKWFENLTNSATQKYFIAGKDDSDIGMVRITNLDLINRNACVGCDVALEYRGRGLGTSLMSLVVSYCFEVLNLEMIWLMVLETNAPALRAYEKVGFKETGRLPHCLYRNGKYQDYILMSQVRK